MLVHIPFIGLFTWQLVFDYDNSYNSASIEHSVRTRLSHSISISTFQQQITEYAQLQARSESRMQFDTSASYRPLSVSFNTQSEFLEEISSFVMKTRDQKDVKWESEHEQFQKYQIGPHSRLALYQLFFKAPGMSYACNVFSTVKKADEVVNFHITMEPVVFIGGLQVAYGSSPSEAPPGRVREMNGLSDDINHGYGGDYVWLVPEYTSVIDDAVTGFDFFVQGNAGPFPDLARGAGGKFRHLVPLKNVREKRKITEVALRRERGGDADRALPHHGFSGRTPDINQGRRGDWLYLEAKDTVT